ncbi:hypothetical protein W823_17460 [Williamsia sp. D3]|nr:hypothetical protein W823_17460 [Williamsia sp. D3]
MLLQRTFMPSMSDIAASTSSAEVGSLASLPSDNFLLILSAARVGSLMRDFEQSKRDESAPGPSACLATSSTKC